MQLLLRKVTIVDPSSSHHGKTVDVLIKRGKIEAIRKNISEKGVKTYDIDGACLSPGWLDIGTQVGEPGYEHREDLESVSRSALSGGYTALAPFPNTSPAIDTSSMVSFWKNRSEHLPIDIYPIGAVSKSCKGEDIAELVDMHEAGAVAFSDGLHPLDNEGLLLRALQYTQRFNGLVIDQPLNAQLILTAQVHEGRSSVMMGMKGQPSTAEYSRIGRNLDLLEYTGGRLCLHLISTAQGVRDIKNLKKKGANVSASVGVFNLCMTEEDVISFDLNLKVNPPLRSDSDRKALIKGLRKGTISVISSQHTPVEEELKERAFYDAVPGAISLQTTFPMLATEVLGDVDIQTLVHGLCHGPRQMLGIDIPTIEAGNEVEATLFHPTMSWTFNTENNLSRSKNSSSFGQAFDGCVLATLTKGKAHWNMDITAH